MIYFLSPSRSYFRKAKYGKDSRYIQRRLTDFRGTVRGDVGLEHGLEEMVPNKYIRCLANLARLTCRPLTSCITTMRQYLQRLSRQCPGALPFNQ